MFQVVGSGADRVEIDPVVGEGGVLDPEDQCGWEQGRLPEVGRWAQGVEVGYQRRAPWMV